VRLQELDGVAAVLARFVVDSALEASVVDALEIHVDDLALVPRRRRVEPLGRDHGVVVEVDHATTSAQLRADPLPDRVDPDGELVLVDPHPLFVGADDLELLAVEPEVERPPAGDAGGEDRHQ